MTFFCILSFAGSPKLTRSRGVGVVYKFVKCSYVPQVESSIDLRSNILGASYEADALQNNFLKNNCLLSVPFTTSYAVELLSK